MRPSTGSASSNGRRPALSLQLPVCRTRVRGTMAILASVFALIAFPNTLIAHDCSDQVVSARGEPASYRWLARTKAMSNWRAKVRIMPGLGDAYANFSRARDTDEQCVTENAGTICKLTGRPCRKN